ncbi:MAG: (2Fe-2S) ferredoxin domain-containing protein [Fibrobacteres bacterium]|nr:(2Fe-2S) ferredoxin domain-containing protein [Fibrobacterota bacterium]
MRELPCHGRSAGACKKKGANDLLGYLEGELADRGMDGVTVSSTACLKACDRGPVMIVHPDNVWYGKVNEEAIDAILDAMQEGETCKEYELT